MRPRALDLFCGAGGAAMGLSRASFDVTGIDHLPQPRYPFHFILGDALQPPVRLEDFDLIWASPPCQGYSRTRHLPWLRGRTHPLLIPAVRELLRSRRAPWVIENVLDSPLSGVILRGGMFGLRYRRARSFESNFLVLIPSSLPEPVCFPGGNFGGGLRKQHEALGFPGRDGDQAVPPAYAEWIGRYAMMALGRES